MRKLLAVVITAAAALIVSPSPAGATSSGLTVDIVSSPKPTLVTGGSALVKLTARSPLRLKEVTVQAGRTDVTDAFKTQPDGSMLGLVEGLRDGTSVIAATLRRSPHTRATERVVNHPMTGPVFSGPQQVPFFCETTAFGLAPAAPPDCAAPSSVSFQYRTTRSTFAPLPDPAIVPPDATVTTVDGRTVPYVVRIERGTIDRRVRGRVSGYGAWGSSVKWDLAFASRGNATRACPPAIPVGYLYNPTTKPSRPSALKDGCWTPAGEQVASPLAWRGTGTCDTLYPSFADTRIAAGAPLRNDVLKCSLKPLSFPGGICDYSRPGVGYRGLAGVWQSY